MSQSSPIQLIIDDQPVQVEKGLTILQAARQNGFDIPTLCDFPGLPSHGSCRMCIVEIQGRPNTPTACTTPAEEGMVIYTHSPKVLALRKELLQMLLAEHPAGCLFCPEKSHCAECMVTVRKAGVTAGCGSCPKNGQCELQALANRYGVDQPGYPIRYRMLPVEKHDPFFDRDDNLCVLCGRCVRVCEHLHFVNTLAHTMRGTHAVVGTAFHRTHLESSCVFCGACIEACPTGALTEKTRKWAGKPEGETATTCPLCSVGCQIKLLTNGDRVIGSLPNRAAGTEALCVKGRFGITELVNHATRLKQPYKRAEQFRQPIDWDEAVRIAAEKLAACPPERFAMRVSASATYEDLLVVRQFARQVMKSPHIAIGAPACSSQGMEVFTRLAARSSALDSIHLARTILCLGFEDSYAQSVVEVQLHQAKKQGAQIIHLGARKLPWSDHADLCIQAAPDAQPALLEQLASAAQPADGSAIAQAADLLRQSASPLIILGPAALTHPQNRALLESLEALIDRLESGIVILPDQANLAGALRLGLCEAGPDLNTQPLDVLYVIGEAIPELPAERPFIIYQNLYPPAGEVQPDLILPMTAFSEEEGTYLDHAARLQQIHPAVSAPGSALPAWKILGRIAQQMGVPGLTYTSLEAIWEMEKTEIESLAQLRGASTSAASIPEPAWEAPAAHTYLGFPLIQFVAGLRSLYPDQNDGGRP